MKATARLGDVGRICFLAIYCTVVEIVILVGPLYSCETYFYSSPDGGPNPATHRDRTVIVFVLSTCSAKIGHALVSLRPGISYYVTIEAFITDQ